MNSNLTFLHIQDKKILQQYQINISQLFHLSFNRTLDLDLWKWIYIDNPIANPLVNFAFVSNQLVGHYALIPIPTTKYKVLLSVTTMVDPCARKYNTFVNLAEKSYLYAKQQNYDLLIGFPNQKSAILHEKLLGWKIHKTFIAQSNFQTFKQTYQLVDKTSDFSLDISNKSYLTWRFKKPRTKYFQQGQNIYKTFQDSIDILTFRDPSLELPQNTKVNFLSNLRDCNKDIKLLFEYPFAYKILNPNINPSVKPELLMSDIF